MKITAADLRAKERAKLQDVIPLDVPFILYIDPCNLCNCKCAFCPTGNSELKAMRPNGVMTMELFKKVVKDLGEFPRKLKRVNLYKDGEPLLNTHYMEMVSMLRQADVAEQIWTKTNGLLLNPEINQGLVDAGMDMIGISVKQVTNAGYKRIAGVDVDCDKLLENLGDLYARKRNCKIYISIADSGLSSSEIALFYEKFSPVSDYIAVERLHGWSMSGVKDLTLGIRSDTFDGIPLKPKIACPWPFYQMAVNWNGAISVCNEDWAHKCIVGDIKTQSLRDVWRGKAMRDFQVMMLEGRRCDNEACRDCYYLMCSPDDIDDHRVAMLKKLGR